MEKAWMAFNYDVPIYSSCGRTFKAVWDDLHQEYKNMHYAGIERGDPDCISIRKIEFGVVKVFTKKQHLKGEG